MWWWMVIGCSTPDPAPSAASPTESTGLDTTSTTDTGTVPSPTGGTGTPVTADTTTTGDTSPTIDTGPVFPLDGDLAHVEHSGGNERPACLPEGPLLDVNVPTTHDPSLLVAPDDHDGDGVLSADDCDDHDPQVFPGAPERCDGVDTDCDPATPADGLATLDATTTFDRVQDALDAAGPGGVVVGCGAVTDNLRIPDGVRLVGLPGNPLSVTPADPSVAVVTMEGASALQGVEVHGGEAGGVLVAPCASAMVRDSTVRDNVGTCGGILADDAELTLAASVVADNTGTTRGGGVCARDAVVWMSDSDVRGNRTDDDGGGLEVSGALTVTASEVSDNRAAGRGGGVFASERLTLGDTVVADNISQQDGGGLRVESGFARLEAVDIRGNRGAPGGGVSASGSLVFADHLTEVTGNDAGSGGGVHLDASERRTVWSGGRIAANTASVGAGVSVATSYWSHAELEHVLIEDNLAENTGGGVQVNGEGLLWQRDTMLRRNQAHEGGGLWLEREPSLAADHGHWGRTGVNDNVPDDLATRDGVVLRWSGAGDVACEPEVCREPDPDELTDPEVVIVDPPYTATWRIAAEGDHMVVLADPPVALHHDASGWHSESLPLPQGVHVDDLTTTDLALDGDRIAIGLPRGSTATGNGVVLVFTFDGTGWSLAHRIDDPDHAWTFGRSVALDGERLVVAGESTTLYDLGGDDLQVEAVLEGPADAVVIEGDTLAVCRLEWSTAWYFYTSERSVDLFVNDGAWEHTDTALVDGPTIEWWGWPPPPQLLLLEDGRLVTTRGAVFDVRAGSLAALPRHEIGVPAPGYRGLLGDTYAAVGATIFIDKVPAEVFVTTDLDGSTLTSFPSRVSSPLEMALATVAVDEEAIVVAEPNGRILRFARD